MRWRYVYPQGEFPYEELLRGQPRPAAATSPSTSCSTPGSSTSDRYWDIEVDYAKAGPDDLCLRVTVRNAGPDAATLHLLPTLWFRNRWSWDDGAPGGRSSSVRDGRAGGRRPAHRRA